MIEGKFEEKCESQSNVIENSLNATAPTVTTIITTTVQSPSEMSNSDVSKDTLLKTLLSTSTALSTSVVSPLTATKISTTVPIESMITKEVNDTQLNLKKILYEPEKETSKDKDQESFVHSASQRNFADIQMIDDDDRLVIDISDDEIDGQKKKKVKAKSMPILDFGIEGSKNTMTNRMPKSITYSVETSGISSSCVKIDILSSTGTFFNSDATEISKVTTSISKNSNISLNDELNILSHEIDKQMNKKTIEILELIKEYLGNSLSEVEFHNKMNDIGNVSVSDLSTIAKKLIKRQKFEANPNQKDFMRMKFLQFPTSSKDLVNYFKNLIPTMNKDKFVNMIKFYEIIIKEMFNLNKTKILQYLVDFMIKRKNAQLDLLNYNYETSSSPNLKQKVSSTSSTFEMPDSTQSIKSERKNIKLHDTSYNFVIRSDPIYLTAGSTFMTNHRDVIKCRSTPCIQNHSFERRPFDNNILKGRRIGRKIMNDINEGDKMQKLIEVNNQFNSEIKSHINIIPGLPLMLVKACPIEEQLIKPKFENDIIPISKPSKAECSSPILVESDTPSSSPPIHKIIKPQIISQQILQRAFSERAPGPPLKEQKQILEKFPKSNHEPTVSIQNNVPKPPQPVEQQVQIGSNTSSNIRERFEVPLINGQLSINEIKTLSQNGTEIIPTPILRNTITSRRKTIDVDHAPVMKIPAEVKKASNQLMKSPAALPTTKSSLSFLYDQSQINKQASKILKRRQSCHERIFAPKPVNTSNIGKNFMDFMTSEYEAKKREAVIKRMPNLAYNDGKGLPYHHKQQEGQKPITPLYSQQKRVRFENSEPSQRSPQAGRTQLTPTAQKPHQIENHSPQTLFRESLHNSLMQPPLKPYQSPIDYQRYQLYFERELRERGFVDRVETLQDRDPNPVSINRPLELVSHVPPERYLQQSESSQSTAFTSPKTNRTFDKSPRSHQRTPIMTNDEKATLVAYNQLQSLHRDPSNLTAQQYSEHLKQIHQFKQMQKTSLNSSQGFSQEQNQLLDGRENTYKNTQQSIHQQPENISSRSYAVQGHDGSNDKEQQSLQRKLKLKSKSTKYVEPSQLSKAYHSTPRSTYYTDPYTMTAYKKPPTPTAYNHSQERSAEQNSQEQLSAFYNLRNEAPINPQLQYQWMIAQAQQQHHQQQQQQHQQQHQNLLNHNLPARPIPRPAIPSPYSDAKLNGIPSNHNIFSHNPLQAFPNQQSDFYRHYFPKSF